jgi:intein/homing endonuclease
MARRWTVLEERRYREELIELYVRRNLSIGEVGTPSWIWERKEYLRGFLRGFFDTDGSYYLLRHGRQISFTNHSLPLLHSLRKMLIRLDYSASEVSAYRVYLTRKGDVDRFFSEIRPANVKHLRRYQVLTRR